MKNCATIVIGVGLKLMKKKTSTCILEPRTLFQLTNRYDMATSS